MTDVKYFKVPFATDGDRTAVPNSPPGDGTLSYDQGYNLYYAQQLGVVPTAKAISREQYNQVLFEVTDAMRQVQEIGAPQFITTTMNGGSPFSYAKNALVWLPDDGNIYQSLVATNTDTPPSVKWQLVGATAPGTGMTSAFRNLKITNGGTPNSQAVLTADAIELQNSTFQNYVARNVTITASTAASGANGIDTGAVAANTWYAVYAIYNPTTNTVAALLSTNATSPTLPSGYTFFARFGYMLTDGSSNLRRTLQYGRSSQFTDAYSTMASNWGSGTFAVAWAAFIPPTATKIVGRAQVTASSGFVGISVRPNTSNSFIAIGSSSGSGDTLDAPFEMVLESSNIYVERHGTVLSSSSLVCMGWEDNI